LNYTKPSSEKLQDKIGLIQKKLTTCEQQLQTKDARIKFLESQIKPKP